MPEKPERFKTNEEIKKLAEGWKRQAGIKEPRGKAPEEEREEEKTFYRYKATRTEEEDP